MSLHRIASSRELTPERGLIGPRGHRSPRRKPLWGLMTFALLLSDLMGCEGEIDPSQTTPPPPPIQEDPIDDILYWNALETTTGTVTEAATFYAITGFAPDDLILTGAHGTVYTYDESGLTLIAELTTQEGEPVDLHGVWHFDDSLGRGIFVVGELGTIFRYRFTDSGFELYETGTRSTFKGVFGFARDDVWAVGDGGAYHFDGEVWSRDTTLPGSVRLNAIWGSGEGETARLYAVGAQGTLYMRGPASEDGAAPMWQQVALGRGEDFHGVWGTEDGQVFVVGQLGVAVRFDTRSWSVVDTGIYDHLWSVFAFSSQEVFAAGTNGQVVFFDGNIWQRLPTGIENNLYGLWGQDMAHVFAAGAWSSLLFYDDDPPPPTPEPEK